MPALETEASLQCVPHPPPGLPHVAFVEQTFRHPQRAPLLILHPVLFQGQTDSGADAWHRLDSLLLGPPMGVEEWEYAGALMDQLVDGVEAAPPTLTNNPDT
jgi:hypothetical protein